MTDRYPAACLVLYTYDRLETAQRTLEAFLARARYSGPLHVHIADDGSPDDDYVDVLRDLAGGFANVETVGHTNAGRRGYGGSYNLASQVTHHHEILIPMEDDWFLREDLDLDPLVQTLLDPAVPIECIRLGYLGFTQTIRGEFLHTPAGVMALLDPSSPEPHVFAGHVRIETREFQRRVGAWPEGIPAGHTEWEVAQRPNARRGVAFPLDLVRPRGGLFEHIGADEKGEIQP